MGGLWGGPQNGAELSGDRVGLSGWEGGVWGLLGDGAGLSGWGKFCS